jgi:hypothetical protein
MRPRPSYRAIDGEEVPPGNPVDLAVHRRVRRPREERRLARAAQAVVDALGQRRRLWFRYEELLGRLTSRQQAAYFDLGVEHGIAAARGLGITRARMTQVMNLILLPIDVQEDVLLGRSALTEHLLRFRSIILEKHDNDRKPELP